MRKMLLIGAAIAAFASPAYAGGWWDSVGIAPPASHARDVNCEWYFGLHYPNGSAQEMKDYCADPEHVKQYYAERDASAKEAVAREKAKDYDACVDRAIEYNVPVSSFCKAYE